MNERPAPDNPVPASVVVERRLAWEDTDASGHYHHGAVIRWVEEAEAVLQERLGLALFGRLPRVHYEVDYLSRLWFGDRVEVALDVAEVGRSSVRFVFGVRRGGDEAARGVMVAVNCPPTGDTTEPWPAEVRRTLLESGPQRPERLT